MSVCIHIPKNGEFGYMLGSDTVDLVCVICGADYEVPVEENERGRALKAAQLENRSFSAEGLAAIVEEFAALSTPPEAIE